MNTVLSCFNVIRKNDRNSRVSQRVDRLPVAECWLPVDKTLKHRLSSPAISIRRNGLLIGIAEETQVLLHGDSFGGGRGLLVLGAGRQDLALRYPGLLIHRLEQRNRLSDVNGERAVEESTGPSQVHAETGTLRSVREQWSTFYRRQQSRVSLITEQYVFTNGKLA